MGENNGIYLMEQDRALKKRCAYYRLLRATKRKGAIKNELLKVDMRESRGWSAVDEWFRKGVNKKTVGPDDNHTQSHDEGSLSVRFLIDQGYKVSYDKLLKQARVRRLDRGTELEKEDEEMRFNLMRVCMTEFKHFFNLDDTDRRIWGWTICAKKPKTLKQAGRRLELSSVAVFKRKKQLLNMFRSYYKEVTKNEDIKLDVGFLTISELRGMFHEQPRRSLNERSTTTTEDRTEFGI